jgi:hypothetical protein
MANVRKPFDRYWIQYTSSKRDLPLASITCFDGSTQVGLLEFVKSDAGLRDPFVHQPSGMIVLSFLLARFDEVIDLLRHEGPLDLFLNPSSKWGSIITRQSEPVGEGE